MQISVCLRFRDDVFGIYRDRNLGVEFCSRYIRKAKPFRVLCETISTEKVEFLELVAAKNLEVDLRPLKYFLGRFNDAARRFVASTRGRSQRTCLEWR